MNDKIDLNKEKQDHENAICIGTDDKPVEIPKGQKVLRFGKQFEEWTDQRKIDYLKKLASAMNQAADMMQNERNVLAQKLDQVQRSLQNAETNLHTQKSINANMIGSSNATQQNYIKDLQASQQRVKTQDKVIKELNERLEG